MGQHSTRMPKPPRMVSRPLVNTCFSLLPTKRGGGGGTHQDKGKKGMGRLVEWVRGWKGEGPPPLYLKRKGEEEGEGVRR